MRKTILKSFVAGLSMAAMALSGPALAQTEAAASEEKADKTDEGEAEEESGAFSISGGATVVSDYRFRGVSLSGEDITIQGTFTVAHKSGFYAGVWASGLDGGTDFGGTEIDIYAGWGGEVAGLTVDANVTQYTYPNQTGNVPVDYLELLASVSKDIGPVNVKVGVGFTPEQSGFGDSSAIYLYNDYAVGIPGTPFTLKAHGGYNKSDFNFDPEVFDYSVGVDTSWKALTFGISYVNTTGSPGLLKELVGADGAVLFTLGASF